MSSTHTRRYVIVCVCVCAQMCCSISLSLSFDAFNRRTMYARNVLTQSLSAHTGHIYLRVMCVHTLYNVDSFSISHSLTIRILFQYINVHTHFSAEKQKNIKYKRKILFMIWCVYACVGGGGGRRYRCRHRCCWFRIRHLYGFFFIFSFFVLYQKQCGMDRGVLCVANEVLNLVIIFQMVLCLYTYTCMSACVCE